MNPKKGTGVVQGAFATGKLILRLESDRIDWVLSPADMEAEELAASAEFTGLGPAMDGLDAFSVIAEKWLDFDEAPAVARIAFGAVFVHQEPDRRAGYLRLPDYVPVVVDPESSDFLYQINLPLTQSTSDIEGLQLNRLSKWAVVRIRVLAFNVMGSAVQPRPTPALSALRLELDINTDPGFEGPIPRTRLVALYREIVAHGRRIATDGVIAQ
ncbi:MAG: hypothetical protein NTY38_16535 [Acidobacteria bacterium]|nr:hypothetical protein [Acidobacteriota bacterium]